MTYVNRNDCFQMLRNRAEMKLKKWKKLEKYWKRLFRNFCFSLIAFCKYLLEMKVDLLLALFFPLFLEMLIGVEKKSMYSARCRWSRIRIFLLQVNDKVSHTLICGNESHWQNIWEKLKISSKLLLWGKFQYLVFLNFLLFLGGISNIW